MNFKLFFIENTGDPRKWKWDKVFLSRSGLNSNAPKRYMYLSPDKRFEISPVGGNRNNKTMYRAFDTKRRQPIGLPKNTIDSAKESVYEWIENHPDEKV